MELRVVRTWTLLVLLCWTSPAQPQQEAGYLVTVPAIIESGTEAKFCASVLEPDQHLLMTVTLRSQENNVTLLERTSDKSFHKCFPFQVPSVQQDEVQRLEVVVKGNQFESKKSQKVMIKVFKPKTYVQTDKPVYLPGQTVNFRVFSLDSKLRSASQLYSIIELVDPGKNRIGQWLNETSHGKILQLSHKLTSEAQQGRYEIILTVGEDKTFQNFKVEKYVLPKFDVSIKAKNEVNLAEDKVDVEVCAKYTFGQPVPGSAVVKMCRRHSYYYGIDEPFICYKQTGKTDRKGCATFEFEMLVFTRVDKKVILNQLEVEATVEEEGTGVSLGKKKTISLSDFLGKVLFEDTPEFYNQSSPLEGKLKAVFYNDTPIVGASLVLSFSHGYGVPVTQTLTTDENGVASFSVDTKRYTEAVHLHAHIHQSEDALNNGFQYELAVRIVSRSAAPSAEFATVSSLLVRAQAKLSCDKEEEISILYTFVREAQGSMDVMLLGLSRGVVVIEGQKKVQVHDMAVNQGEVSFKIRASADMAPEVHILAYAVLPSKEVIAHEATISVEKCLEKVSVDFSPSPALPGEEVDMQLSAPPNSLCGISAIDQSVNIQEPGNWIDHFKIFNLLPLRRIYIPYEVVETSECVPVRPKRYILPPPPPPPYPASGETDAFKVFQTVGLQAVTNLILKMPTCLKYKGNEYHMGRYPNYASPFVPQMGFAGPMGMSPGPVDMGEVPRHGAAAAAPGPRPAPAAPLETVRTFFPETWIWDLVEVGESGVQKVSHTVPDTITTWDTETFCLSSQGFSLALPQKLTVFQPFFLELTLPYSIIRGEKFELKATVFNYLTSCIMIKVTPADSSDYTLTPLSGDQYTSCLCGGERRTLRWNLAPATLGVMNVSVSAEAVPSHASCDNEIVEVPERGRIDRVTQKLRVKAEGTEVTKAFNWLLCPNGGALTEKMEIKLPENVIQGSTRGTVSVLGDILGRALNNLDGLLQMPYGCGEQNMALLAPDIYILHYLKDTNQLTEQIKDKVLEFLKSGYQRQLNYKNSEGAYTTFGAGPGNTWLTAFVLRSFHKAQSFIYIDPEKTSETRSWLEQQQRETGSYIMSGKLFNNRMKGGVSDEITLTAYITAAFLEMGTSPQDVAVSRGVSCLKESMTDLSNTYTTALMAYVFTLAGETVARDTLLTHLDSVAMREGGFLHWSRERTGKVDSLSVEITSYVLLAKLSASPTAEDLGYASGIVRWLASQQNYYGGYSSTQDTVVALQALALYSSLVFTRDGSSMVTVQSPAGRQTFDVNPNNKLLYQESELQEVEGSFNVEVKGAACAAVQVSLFYNVPTPKETETLRVDVVSEVDKSTQKPKVTLKLTSAYTGREAVSNMVIIDIALLSGFIPDKQSLSNLKAALLVDRVEYKDGHVVVYLQELSSGIPINHQLVIQQEHVVENLKPAVVTIYDYYQPSDRAEKEYTVAI